MTPIDRLRIEKAAADCGFEMTPTDQEGGLKLRSARFPESAVVRVVDAADFEVEASSPLLLDEADSGARVTVRGYEALYEILKKAAAHARTLPNRVADAFRRETATMPRTTEAERVVVQRVGQNLFRSALLDYWQGKCCITGLDIPELLRASHIKPWASCSSDDERLDVFNGLLLAPHLDALFDSGWMTINPDGTARLSSALPYQARETLGVNRPLTVRALRPEHLPYLAFHAESVFRLP
jgi:putative restriction endonuclease